LEQHTGNAVGVKLTRSLVCLSTSASSVGPSPVMAQPPLLSAFMIAASNFISAAMRQVELTAVPVAIAFW